MPGIGLLVLLNEEPHSNIFFEEGSDGSSDFPVVLLDYLIRCWCPIHTANEKLEA